MVKEYSDGKTFYEENKEFLLSDKYTEPLFRLDSPLLTQAGKNEYAMRFSEGKATLLVLCVEPYSIMMFGDVSLADELVCYLTSNGYLIKNFMCPMNLGEKLMESFKKEGYDFHVSLGMDFMEAKEKNDTPSDGVEIPTEGDVDEVYELICSFVRDCGLSDVIKKERIRSTIGNYRILRKDGRIISIVKIHEWTDSDSKLTSVYTRDEYRNRGFARIVVGSAVNEIIDSGKIAVLNVDMKNPVSNHLYASLGFKKIFSQGVFSL